MIGASTTHKVLFYVNRSNCTLHKYKVALFNSDRYPYKDANLQKCKCIKITKKCEIISCIYRFLHKKKYDSNNYLNKSYTLLYYFL